MTVEIHALTPSRWDDFVDLFGPSRAVSGCWCMFWRQSRQEWQEHTDEGKRRAMRQIVKAKRRPGLIAYREDRPVGWVSIAPRTEFERLNRSRRYAPIDSKAVWSVVCFYIRPGERGRGVAAALLSAAIDEARSRGATTIEAYPVDPGAGRTSNADAYTGVVSMYERAGFREAARRSGNPIMRKTVRPSRKRTSQR